jgi:dynein heavy chain, axonemal
LWFLHNYFQILNTLMDYRIEWLKQKISAILGVDELEILEAALVDHDDGIKEFFDAVITDYDDMDRRILYVYRTFYDKLIEEEIIVLEAGEFS